MGTSQPDFKFTDEDRALADAYADRTAKRYTYGWHKARDGYLSGLADERRKLLGNTFQVVRNA